MRLQETLRLTAPPLLAFMDSQLRAGNPDVQQRITDFYRFIDAEEAEDTVRFSIKPGVLLLHSVLLLPATCIAAVLTALQAI